MIAGEQSALVFLVPEAEPLVKEFRDSYDPAAGDGMPAHVTLLFPFIPPNYVGVDVLDQLRVIFARQPRFTIQFAEARLWPEVLYLAPSPERPFVKLIQAVARRFPSYPPYEGEFDDVSPHLTVAQPESAGQLDGITARFLQASDGILPIHVRLREVWLMVKHDGIWAPHAAFQLGDSGMAETSDE
jgi:2'-5' RNA ligase